MGTVIKTIPVPKGTNLLPDADAYAPLKDSLGRPRTQSLFVEYKHDKYPAPFTLKPYDHRGRMSMYRKYMEIGDPTEYSQAIGLLGSWEHWQTLCAAEWFKPFVEKWRAELKVKYESERYREMQEVADTCKGTPQGIQATRWLAERYSTPTAPKRGRPSKAEKKAALRRELEEDELLQEEALRLGL